jgi:hypothetical protein
MLGAFVAGLLLGLIAPGVAAYLSKSGRRLLP